MSIDWNTATSDEILREMRKTRDYLISRCGPSAEPNVFATSKGWFSLKPVWKKGKVKKRSG